MAILNIGLNIPDSTEKLYPLEALHAAIMHGARPTGVAVKQSRTETTLVVEIERPLTERSAYALSEALRQECIAQLTDEGGALIGPKAAKWGKFNPAYFLTL